MFEHAQQLLKSKKPDEVARALNEQGFRNSSGDLWNKESVSWFLCFFFAARRCQLCDCYVFVLLVRRRHGGTGSL